MIHKTFLKSKYGILLLLSIFFICLASVFAIIIKSEKKLDRQLREFQRTLNLKERGVKNLLVKISEKDLTDSIIRNSFLYDKSFIGSCQRKDIIIAIYYYDSLIFWSDNVVPLEEVSKVTLNNQGIRHFNNGWFELLKLRKNQFVYLGFIKIKNDYKYQNEYLVNEFQEDFKVGNNVKINLRKGTYNVFSSNDRFLFSLDLKQEKFPSDAELLWLFAIFSLGFLFLTGFMYHFYKDFPLLSNKPKLFILVFAIDLLILRYLLFYFKIPHIIYESKIFSPIYYAASDLLPSLGDLLFNTLIMLPIAYAFYMHFRLEIKDTVKKIIKYSLSFLILFSVVVFFQGLIFILKGIILNSNISFNLNNILSLSPLSIIGFLIISLLLLIYLLFSLRLLEINFQLIHRPKEFFILAAISFLIIALVVSYFQIFKPVNLLILFCFVCSYWFFRKKSGKTVSASSIVFYLLLFSALVTYSLHYYKNEKEGEKRKLLAIRLSTERDQITEFKFKEIMHKLNNDDTLFNYFKINSYNPDFDANCVNYITDVYFKGYWLKYDIQITICNQAKELNIMPGNYIINCNNYFDGIVNDFGNLTLCDNLYYLDYGSGTNNYLALLNIHDSILSDTFNIYIEFLPKDVAKGQGYPELLINKEVSGQTDISGYSYAYYNKGELLRHVGKFFYSISLSNYGPIYRNFRFFNKDGYNHLLYNINEESSLIISKKKATYLEFIAPFSYLFVFSGCVIIVFILIICFSVNVKRIYLNFKNRVQISMIVIILISFLLVGIMTLNYIVWLNNNKNRNLLSEKTHSVLIELEHKLADQKQLTSEITNYLSELLIKFSQVFFADINIYDLKGNLLASSRPQIFEEGLISTKMNALAYANLAFNQKSLFIQNEKIGNYDYYSAYVPFRNNQNKMIAYLNLPYFAKQDEFKNEISTFLIAFINIYVILIAFSIFITLLVSSYITRPLKIIMSKIGKVQLDKPNEKIQWERDDEIGNLISEYNRMIDELSHSAELLARSERESAWREMAKQVAHEIKNPLTPMKLSVQYLQKAWQEKTVDWEERLNRFTSTIVEQIDSLSSIASEFSDFAKMPKTKNEKVEIVSIIENAIELYKDLQRIHIKFIRKHKEIPYYVFADKKQLLRVFNNLIKNSIQAIGTSKQGIIEICIEQQQDNYLIVLSDNGSGISQEQAAKIFYPNFTTKTGGMGLGLAIVKSIILSTAGEIWFESEEGKGTTFYIRLPVYNE